MGPLVVAGISFTLVGASSARAAVGSAEAAAQLRTNGVVGWADPTECPCDSWGIADGTTGLGAIFGDVRPLSRATPQPAIDQLGSAATGNSVVQVGLDADTATRVLRVSHTIRDATASSLTLDVMIVNVGTQAVADMRYRRAIRWTGAVVDDLSARQGAAAVRLLGQAAEPHPMNSSVTDPTVESIDLGFGALAPGASVSFRITYVSTVERETATAELARLGAEVFLLGRTVAGGSGSEPTAAYVALGAADVGGAPFVEVESPAAGTTTTLVSSTPASSTSLSSAIVAVAQRATDADLEFGLTPTRTEPGATRKPFDGTSVVVSIVAGIFAVALVAGAGSRFRNLWA